MQKYKYSKALAFAGSPLMSGGFVCDLVGTNKPGAKWAEAAAQAVARGSIRDEVIYSMEAVKEDARANGFDAKEAVRMAMWAAVARLPDDLAYLKDKFEKSAD